MKIRVAQEQPEHAAGHGRARYRSQVAQQRIYWQVPSNYYSGFAGHLLPLPTGSEVLHSCPCRSAAVSDRFSRPDALPPGKVRDVYDLGDTLLIVATDRISAFDYVLGSGIPDKGKVLTQLSAFWFGRPQRDRPQPLPHDGHRRLPGGGAPVCLGADGPVDARRKDNADRRRVCGARVPVGHRAGRNTRQTGRVCGVVLPPGLREADRLPEPIFTPATKADRGHDNNIERTGSRRVVGDPALVARLKATDAVVVSGGVRARGVMRHHPGGHEVRVRPDRRAASCC